ncbi:MAG TPA: type IV pilus twitching motility protein PilT [Thermodesulfobacteriota bacterium]
MPQLDSFFKVMLAQAGAEVRIAADAEPQLRSAGSARPLVAKKLSAAQVRFLVGEIATEAAKAALLADGAAQFTYEPAGLGAVEALVRDWGGRTEARFRPAGAAPSHDAPAAAAPAPPPRAARVAAGEPPINALFRRMVEMSASDLHLSTGEKPMVRAHGDMVRFDDAAAFTAQSMRALLDPIMPERNRKEFDAVHDTDFAYEIKGLARFRANVFMDRKGPGAVFRVIPSEIITAEQLGLSPEVQNLCYLTKGLVLVTGPTGSGKSTTLCAMVDLINRKRNDHVITIEDPIEFVHENKNCLINQREVGEHTESFKRALRAALREDPDIILVGEMRDLETIAIAIETAETGHLVFGTLHTSTAPSTVDRIIDQFPSDRQSQIRVMLSESLKGVISQTLCKKIGGGRVAAMETLIVTPAVSNLIREGKTFQIPSIMQTSRKQGMVLLNDALFELVQAKKVEPKEAYMKAVDKAGLATMLKSAGHRLDFLEAAPKPGEAATPAAAGKA